MEGGDLDKREKFALSISNVLTFIILSIYVLSTFNIPGAYKIKNTLNAAIFSIYDIVSVFHLVDNEKICVLADIWDMQGIKFKYENETYDCANIQELFKQGAFKDAKKYEDILDNENIIFQDKTTVSFLFLWGFLLLGLAITFAITDSLWLSGILGFGKNTYFIISIFSGLVLLVTLITLNINNIFNTYAKFLTIFNDNVALALAILIFGGAMLHFVLASIAYGFSLGLKGRNQKYEALKKAIELERMKGELLQRYAK